jgi:hypothetical protein
MIQKAYDMAKNYIAENNLYSKVSKTAPEMGKAMKQGWGSLTPEEKNRLVMENISTMAGFTFPLSKKVQKMDISAYDAMMPKGMPTMGELNAGGSFSHHGSQAGSSILTALHDAGTAQDPGKYKMLLNQLKTNPQWSHLKDQIKPAEMMYQMIFGGKL